MCALGHKRTYFVTMMTMVAFTLPRRATRRKLGIQRYKARAGCQIVTLFEQAAWLERRMGKAAALAHIY
jgi:NADPH-dependent 7-cyano-7-deazaguanine reductase QueF-like protein